MKLLLSYPFAIIDYIGYLSFFLEIFVMQLVFMRRFTRRSVFWARLLICVAVACAFVFLPDISAWIFNVSYLIICLYCVIAAYFCFETKIHNCAFYVFSAWAVQHIAWSLFMIFCFSAAVEEMFAILIYILIFVATYAAMFFVFSFRRTNWEIVSERIPSTILAATVLILTVFLYDIINEFAEQTIWYSVYAIISCLLVLFVQYGISRNEILIRQKSELVSENCMLEDMLRTQGKQQKLEEETVDIINQKCHDLKHQISALRMTGTDERDRYLDEIENAVMIYGDIAKTGNEALDVVLTERCLLCEEFKIKFTYIVDGKCLDFMSAVDISTLFGNMLDNALESLRKIEKERRIIRLNVAKESGCLRVRCENYYDGKITFADGLPVSDRAATGYHGFGTKSMKYIVEKYGGKMIVSAEEGLFCVNAVFPIFS